MQEPSEDDHRSRGQISSAHLSKRAILSSRNRVSHLDSDSRSKPGALEPTKKCLPHNGDGDNNDVPFIAFIRLGKAACSAVIPAHMNGM
ncbi:hypothetical protein SKAU_G00127490 [Synaphobranchus kaupii]|uniref:Uncharacterized protein n=1 Tax=Synaphobranchus kaupii TaxID=118154 RepID=A0A9Q1J307_SYNKA|nr:hypothetical protein SKAU_G00127490 [Synaphobranchus kaupii]